MRCVYALGCADYSSVTLKTFPSMDLRSADYSSVTLKSGMRQEMGQISGFWLRGAEFVSLNALTQRDLNLMRRRLIWCTRSIILCPCDVNSRGGAHEQIKP